MATRKKKTQVRFSLHGYRAGKSVLDGSKIADAPKEVDWVRISIGEGPQDYIDVSYDPRVEGFTVRSGFGWLEIAPECSNSLVIRNKRATR